MNANLRNFALWVIIVLLLLALFTLFQNPSQRAASQDISFSQLLNEVEQGRVRDVLIQGPEIHGTFSNGQSFQTYAPNDPSLIQRLYGKGVAITARPQGDSVPWFVSLLVSWLPFIALIGVWIFLSRQMQGAGGKALGFGKSRAKLLTEAHGRITFEDVAGVDEAKRAALVPKLQYPAQGLADGERAPGVPDCAHASTGSVHPDNVRPCRAHAHSCAYSNARSRRLSITSEWKLERLR